LDARLVERWRPSDERPEILTQSLTWAPPGAPAPFQLNIEGYFSRVLD
jgi:hypothetical protein